MKPDREEIENMQATPVMVTLPEHGAFTVVKRNAGDQISKVAVHWNVDVPPGTWRVLVLTCCTIRPYRLDVPESSYFDVSRFFIGWFEQPFINGKELGTFHTSDTGQSMSFIVHNKTSATQHFTASLQGYVPKEYIPEEPS